MNQIIKYLYILPIVFCLLQTTSFAQNTIKGEDVTVTKAFEPSVGQFEKITDSPEATPVKIDPIPVSYKITPQQHTTAIRTDTISPAKMKSEPISKLYNNLIKLGYGTYNTPYAEVFFGSLRAKDINYSIRLKHLSSKGKIQNVAYSGMSNNEIALAGSKIFKQHTLRTNATYTYNKLHFYGFNPSLLYTTDYSKNDIKQYFNYFNIQSNFFDNYADSLNFLKHNIELYYHYLNDNYDTHRHNIKLNTTFSKKFHFGTIYLQANGLYLNNQSRNNNRENGISKFTPYYQQKFIDNLTLNLGLSIINQYGDVNKLNIFPYINTHYTVADFFQLYFQLKGDVIRNGYKAIITKNPFVDPNVRIENITYKPTIVGGIKGNLSSTVNYILEADYNNIHNNPFFVLDTLKPLKNQFKVVYDEVKLLHLKGEINYTLTEKWLFNFNTEIYNYKTTKETKAWHEPSLRIATMAKYNLQNKFILSTQIFALNQQYAPSLTNDTAYITLNGIIDINLGIEYRYNKKLSAFLNLNNLANVRYYKWQNYPLQRFNGMLGITYTF